MFTPFFKTITNTRMLCPPPLDEQTKQLQLYRRGRDHGRPELDRSGVALARKEAARQGLREHQADPVRGAHQVLVLGLVLHSGSRRLLSHGFRDGTVHTRCLPPGLSFAFFLGGHIHENCVYHVKQFKYHIDL